MESNTDTFHFLFIGNLLYMKGLLVLLEACKLLKCRQSHFVCHIVGAPTGELGIEDLQAIVLKTQLQDNIQIHGALYGDDKKQILEQSQAFLFPTLDDCFPLVVLEAMQSGLPVIASAAGAGIAGNKDNFGALCSKAAGNGLANAAAGTSYNSCFTCKSIHSAVILPDARSQSKRKKRPSGVAQDVRY